MGFIQRWGRRGMLISSLVLCLLMLTIPAFAESPLPPNPQNGSAGLQGKIPAPPPKTAATIATPTNGASFAKLPVSVNGLCTTDLLVKVFANNVFVGSARCTNGSYGLQIDLFEGQNDVVARIFDALDQPGPDSNKVSLSYSSGQFAAFGTELLSLSSIYAQRGANPGEQLTWPITITGGVAPYAISTDWGDGKSATLQSELFAGNVDVRHVYDTAGTYVVIVKATDKNGLTAYLQLVGQANGAVTQSSQKASETDGLVATRTSVVWVPAAMSIPLILTAFWLGRRFELSELRKRLEQQDQK